MNHSRIVITVAVLFSLLAASQALAALTPKLEWIRTYDSPDHGADRAWGVAVDSSGHVYANGHIWRGDLNQHRNIWLSKHDTNGSLLWDETYDSPAHSDDIGRGVAVDEQGNVYVTGYQHRPDISESYNIYLRKYDTNGHFLWEKDYDSPSHSIDAGYGIGVDPLGNVYVTGYETRDDLGQERNMWLGKYDANGNTLWVYTYDSPQHDHDFLSDVVADAAGNAYVTGQMANDIWVRKYDTNGIVLWTETYDSPAHGDDRGCGIAVDATGNVYVAGIEERSDLGQDWNVWLRKYNPHGNILWTRTYDGPAHGADMAFDLAVDAIGGVYVTGYEDRDDLGQGRNIWLRRYDTNGNVLWTETYDGPVHFHDIGYGVAVDAASNIYVAGFVDNENELYVGGDIILLKYAQVPEPSTLLLLAPALLGFAGLLRRRLR